MVNRSKLGHLSLIILIYFILCLSILRHKFSNSDQSHQVCISFSLYVYKTVTVTVKQSFISNIHDDWYIPWVCIYHSFRNKNKRLINWGPDTSYNVYFIFGVTSYHESFHTKSLFIPASSSQVIHTNQFIQVTSSQVLHNSYSRWVISYQRHHPIAFQTKVTSY